MIYFKCAIHIVYTAHNANEEGQMREQQSSGLERLWRRGELERTARVGLSLDRIVQAAIELADKDGLGAVSMKRVAEALGFTTMSLYRYVASKDELLLLMEDFCWRPEEGFAIRGDDWREGLARWTREQYAIIQRHPWLEQVRHIDRAGTPSQIMWMDLGLGAMAGTQLTEHDKIDLLLLLSGFVFAEARTATTAADGIQKGYFAPGHAAKAFAQLLLTLTDGERFPYLRRAAEGGGFSDEGPFPDFDFDLSILLDGIARLVERRAAG